MKVLHEEGFDAIRYSSKNDLRIKPVKWLTDACSIIAKSGSKKDILQELALDIFNIIFENEISVEVSRFLERIIN